MEDENEWKKLTDRIEAKNCDSYIENLKNNLKSRSEQEKLEAAWGIFMLGYTYIENGNKNLGKFVYKKIEKDLSDRKIIPNFESKPRLPVFVL